MWLYALDSAAAGIELAISNRKSNALTTMYLYPHLALLHSHIIYCYSICYCLPYHSGVAGGTKAILSEQLLLCSPICTVVVHGDVLACVLPCASRSSLGIVCCCQAVVCCHNL